MTTVDLAVLDRVIADPDLQMVRDRLAGEPLTFEDQEPEVASRLAI